MTQPPDDKTMRQEAEAKFEPIALACIRGSSQIGLKLFQQALQAVEGRLSPPASAMRKALEEIANHLFDKQDMERCRELAREALSISSPDTELEDLRRWKREMLQVIKDLDLQAIGKEMDLELGDNIAAKILPYIKAQKAVSQDRADGDDELFFCGECLTDNVNCRYPDCINEQKVTERKDVTTAVDTQAVRDAYKPQNLPWVYESDSRIRDCKGNPVADCRYTSRQGQAIVDVINSAVDKTDLEKLKRLEKTWGEFIEAEASGAITLSAHGNEAVKVWNELCDAVHGLALLRQAAGEQS